VGQYRQSTQVLLTRQALRVPFLGNEEHALCHQAPRLGSVGVILANGQLVITRALATQMDLRALLLPRQVVIAAPLASKERARWVEPNAKDSAEDSSLS